MDQQFKINFPKNTSKKSAFAFLENADNFYKQQYASKGYVLLDYILDGLGIKHKPFGLVGFGKYNPYAMVFDCVSVVAGGKDQTEEYVTEIYIHFDVRDYNDAPNIDGSFLKNKMALRGATIKELKQMDILLNKYFPKGLMY